MNPLMAQLDVLLDFYKKKKAEKDARWAHQEETFQRGLKTPHMLDFSDPGCVSAETEFLTPTGWKRIDTYEPGDQVAQFHPESKNIDFVFPSEYIKRPCREMIAIAPVRGTSQRLSSEHRVLFYRPDGSWGFQSAKSFMEELHQKGAPHLHKKFACTFNPKGTTRLPLTEEELRIMVDVIADGCLTTVSTKRFSVRLKKARKQQRLHELLLRAGIEYNHRKCNSAEGFEIFSFYAPLAVKTFSTFWEASPEQLEIIADEVKHWDSSIDKRNGESIRFSSYKGEDSDFIQYALAANGWSTSLRTNIRERRGSIEIEYYVRAYKNGGYVGPGRKTSVYEIPNFEGFKYCFTVPTGCLLLRHDGLIFATGNTGKSRAHLDIFRHRLEKGESDVCFILAPKTLLETAWGGDLDRFHPDLRYSVAYAANREAAFEREAQVYITNLDAVKWLAERPKRWWSKHFGSRRTLLIDESSFYKNKDSQRSKAAAQIRDLFEYRAGLTATPNPISVTELWHQAYLIDGGERLGTSFYKFRGAVQHPVDNGWGVKWVDNAGVLEAVGMLIADITVRHDFDTCMDIPPNLTKQIYFDLSKKLLAAYEEMEERSIIEEKESMIIGVNAAVRHAKLLQIASGAAYNNRGKGEYTLIDGARYELVADLIAQCPHSITFYSWEHQKKETVKHLVARGIEHEVLDRTVSDKRRKGLVAAYQRGDFQTLLLHPQTGAHGLTLTRGTTTIFSSPLGQADFLKQAKHRIYRGGQTQRTYTKQVCARNTVEDLVYQRGQTRSGRMGSFLELMTENRKRREK